MNTRKKIRPFEDLRSSLASSAWTVVAGRFDPVTSHVAEGLQRLAIEGRKLLVVVQDYEDQLLSADARAVLLAALRSVDAVLIEDSNPWREVVGGNSKARLVEDASEDGARTQTFKELVLSRRSRVEV